MTPFAISSIAAAVIPAYWAVGVVVSVLDFKVRNWMHNYSRFNLEPPMGIKPQRVVQFWIAYVPIVLVGSVFWAFSTGAGIAHKILLQKMHK